MTTANIIPHLPSFLPPKRGFTFVVRARPKPNLLAEPRRPMALCRVRFGLCFGLGLASFAANTRQTSGEKAGGDIDFATFYILPVPSSLSAKWPCTARATDKRRVRACRRNTPSASATIGSARRFRFAVCHLQPRGEHRDRSGDSTDLEALSCNVSCLTGYHNLPLLWQSGLTL